MKHTWTLPIDFGRKRLDVFLAEEMPDVSRSQIAKQLKRGAGIVNEKVAVVHQFLKAGDSVEFDTEAPKQAPQSQKGNTPKKTSVRLPPLRIIEETPDWIVIDKPAGVLVHPDAHEERGTLVDALVAHVPAMAKIGEDPSRPGIMHRLDREVSGLMVIAKTQAAYDDLKRQFATHSVDKRYLALVHGIVHEDEGDIKFRIARSTTKRRMAARPENEKGGKAAWTHYKTLKRFRTASLLELTILSGRTHQIRAHLFAYNHPVIGDPLYMNAKTSRRSMSIPLETSGTMSSKTPDRLMLQSVHLSFIDPATHEQKTFDLPPVPEFATIMQDLA